MGVYKAQQPEHFVGYLSCLAMNKEVPKRHEPQHWWKMANNALENCAKIYLKN